MNIIDVLGKVFDSIAGVFEISDDGKIRLTVEKERRVSDDGKSNISNLNRGSKDS